MLKVLVVEDEEMIRKGIVLAVDWAALDCVVVGEAADGAAALDAVERYDPSLIITDLKMPRMDGIQMLQQLRARGNNAYVIILTAYDSFSYAQSALRLGAVDYCLKPMDAPEARGLLERPREFLRSRPAAPAQDAPEIACSSEQFAALLRHVNAHINEPLVLGELAQRFFINVSYCGELFKTVTGETFTHYVRRRRLEQACDLLEHTALPLTQIAARVGYADLPYFSRVFTASYGVSPSRYRAAARAGGRRP